MTSRRRLLAALAVAALAALVAAGAVVLSTGDGRGTGSQPGRARFERFGCPAAPDAASRRACRAGVRASEGPLETFS